MTDVDRKALDSIAQRDEADRQYRRDRCEEALKLLRELRAESAAGDREYLRYLMTRVEGQLQRLLDAN